MKTNAGIELVESARAAVPRQSVRGLAKALQCDPAQIAHIRSGRNLPGEELTIKLAQIAGKDPAIALMEIAAERSNVPAAAALWSRLAKQASGAATVAILSAVLIVGLMLPNQAFASAGAASSNLTAYPLCAFIDGVRRSVSGSRSQLLQRGRVPLLPACWYISATAPICRSLPE